MFTDIMKYRIMLEARDLYLDAFSLSRWQLGCPEINAISCRFNNLNDISGQPVLYFLCTA
ncbi:MAG: hypothetical protein GQF41_4607 [Candidatus Rifleibacterium amylolyticum]|nr:MAG: hypothetical protein GQF41_4607 [Candidatus Rifleibacterium amylolyticum]